MKQKCDMRRGQCTTCANANKKCRYNDPWEPDRQIRPYQFLIDEEQLADAQAQIEFYEHQSLASISIDNPLSGITGYGPRPATEARQNYARLRRGMPPILRPLPGNAIRANEKAGKIRPLLSPCLSKVEC